MAEEHTPVAGAADSEIPLAATLILLRDGAQGAEVLVIERPDRGSFAGAWVFPGGKLEPGERGLPGGSWRQEEAGARRAAVRETQEETGLTVAADDLVALARWTPPAGVRSPFRTWFFVGHDPGGDILLEPGEAVACTWVTPRDALRRHGDGKFLLYPPTWIMLHLVGEQRSVEGVLTAARTAGTRKFDAQMQRDDAGTVFSWDDDTGHREDRRVTEGRYHRLDVSALPWAYRWL